MDGSTGSPPWQVDQEFVQRLARRLLNDAHEAEDVTQEVWLTLLHRPPPPGSTPRRWMAAVVRNLAVDRHRERGRRSRAELGSAAPEAPPQPPALVARAAVRLALAEAVARLREPYREAVRLRFYEGLEVGQIAHRLDVPIETVRTRLKRALAQLSAELERGARGDRRTWLEGLVLLAGRPAEMEGARRPRLTRLAGTTAATVLVAAIVLVWRGHERAQLVGAADRARLADAVVDPPLVPGTTARAPVAPPDASAAQATRATGARGGTSSLTGRVVDGFGAPVSGATVGVWLDAPPERAGATLTAHARETVSDAVGLFRLEALPERFFLYAEARGLVGQDVLVAELDGPRALDGLVLHVGPPRTLTGTVLDEAGQALAGAEIELLGGGRASSTSKRWSGVDGILCAEQLGSRVLSASDGTFRMTGLTDAVSKLQVTRAGFVGAERVASAGDREIEIRLERGVMLSIRVVDERAASVAGAQVVALVGRIERSSGVSDSRGRVELGRFHAPGSMCLRIEAPGRAPLVQGWFSFDASENTLVVQLPSTRGLSVRVRDRTGRPVSGAELALFGRLSDMDGVPDAVRKNGARRLARLADVRSDADGQATFPALPEGELGLEILDAESRTAVQVFDVAPGIEQLEVHLDASGPRSLSGVLRDGETGRALGRDARAALWLDEEGGSWCSLIARADENGAYRIPVPDGGSWNGCVLARGYAPLCFTPRKELGAGADLVLYPERDARLLLTDRNGVPLRSGCILVEDEGGEPLVVRKHDSKWSSEVRIGTDGQVLLSGLPDAPIFLTCYPEGAHVPLRKRFEPRELSATPVLFAHEGFELDATGVPVVLEVLDAQGGDATVPFVGEGRLQVSDGTKRVTHELAFSARPAECLLEQERRVRELRFDAPGFLARIRDGNKASDDWGPRSRLPGFEGQRALFPLQLAPGPHEVLLVRAGEPELRVPFTVPASRSPLTVRIVVGAN